jgi:beta-N-acetylhexosaminidase
MIRRLSARLSLLFLLGAVTVGYQTNNLDTTFPASEMPMDIRIERIIAGLSLERKIGQLFIIDLRSSNSTPVLEITREVHDLIERTHPGGVLLFGANIDTVEQTRSLVTGLQEAGGYSDDAPIPLFIATDYEGGLVSRLTSSGKIPATPIPPQAVLGKTGDAALAYRVGGVMGRELAAVGITMNFAPVADIRTNPDSMIGNRAFSDDPTAVAAMVAAVVEGMQAVGVSSVVKHFPGHGDTTADSHDGLVSLPHDIERLREIELKPFVAAIESGVDGIMTAHIAVPAISGEGVPTTFSPELITGVLRDELGFDGLIMTDSLTMRAIRKTWDSGESAVKAILAGADIILQPLDPDRAVAGMIDAVRSGVIPEARLDESVERILRIKLKRGGRFTMPPDPDSILGSAEHLAILSELDEHDR